MDKGDGESLHGGFFTECRFESVIDAVFFLSLLLVAAVFNQIISYYFYHCALW